MYKFIFCLGHFQDRTEILRGKSQTQAIFLGVELFLLMYQLQFFYVQIYLLLRSLSG